MKPKKLQEIVNMDFTSLYPTMMRDFLNETEHDKQVRLRNKKIEKIINRIKNDNTKIYI